MDFFEFFSFYLASDLTSGRSRKHQKLFYSQFEWDVLVLLRTCSVISYGRESV